MLYLSETAGPDNQPTITPKDQEPTIANIKLELTINKQDNTEGCWDEGRWNGELQATTRGGGKKGKGNGDGRYWHCNRPGHRRHEVWSGSNYRSKIQWRR